MSAQKAPGPWDQYKAAPRPVKYGLPVLIVILILGLVNSGSSTKTVTSASVTCGTGTRLSGGQCVAKARKTRIVVHTHTVTRTVTVTTPAPASAPTEAPSTAPNTAPDESTEDVGSLSHAGDAEFCSTHSCIESFSEGNGAVVQCVDGEYSHSGGLSGACSDHGGEE